MQINRLRFRLFLISGLTLAVALTSCSRSIRGEHFKLQPIPEGRYSANLIYPPTAKGDTVEDYHGTAVTDPYRWLEDLDATETRAWVTAQNQVTFDFLKRIPGRGAIEKRLTEHWNYEKYSSPTEKNGRYFYTYNDGLQNQAALYVQDGLNGKRRLLLDPNTWSEEGTAALQRYSVSENGEWLAYGIAKAGSDWTEWYVRNVDTGEDLEDHLQWVKFSGAAWSHDHKGFFYSRYPNPPEGDAYEAINSDQKVYYHRIGTPQSQDELVYERPDKPKWIFGTTVSENGRWLIITGYEGTDQRNRVWFKDLQNGGGIQPLFTDFDASYNFVGNVDEDWYFHTDLLAPKQRLIKVHPDKPQAWKEILPETDDTLEDVRLYNHSLLAVYMHNAHNQASVYDLDGYFQYEIDLPTFGTVGGLSGKLDRAEAFYSFSSFIYPNTLFRIDLTKGTSEVYRKPEIDFDSSAFEVNQVWYASKDGTKIPMFLVHKKGLQRNGANPTLLYGYGGFNISLTPGFRASHLVWLEKGGIYAVPNLRGGGEFGKEWHQAGTIHNKQNVFDDFIAAAEWLIAEDYTCSPRLAIFGGSNGGLLVGACMTQRPELFGAALPAVGVMDMLRFHKFTIGWAWVSDYGSSENPEEFRSLYAYSPLHNMNDGEHYPATLVTTGDHDDRVVPGHSYKFAAALQEAQGGTAPVLIRIETDAGHGAGKPTSKSIAEYADRWAFLTEALQLN